MAKRRRVGNLLALALLSALVERPMHPYEMATVLRERGKDRDMPIKWGSLYTVVQNLEKHGLVRATGSVREGGRPERTVYELTEEGRAELADWVRELVSTPEPELPRFKAGLSIVMVLPPAEVITLLRRRLDTLEEQLAENRAALAAESPELPRVFLIEAEYDNALRAAEIAWVRSLLDELTAGTLPGQAGWQSWHDTGQPPTGGEAFYEGSK
jgi:DNA-binding PadR family transcriptional regulator